MTQRTFKEAYGVLQRHAETLRDQEDPNIDDLLTIVTESVEAYKVCKDRIDAVEEALKAALDGVGVGAAQQAPPVRPAAQTPNSATGRMSRDTTPTSTEVDDDIPF
ncbi:exodeoxyribonuclease VII small subunit [Variovorax sp. RCC_210]|uniref:exodeoxyribonuclease VII small subunit n=1 Tax=Variovorax sp. RCC_210 TaxID=3239217 RepID=UPI003524AD1D